MNDKTIQSKSNIGRPKGRVYPYKTELRLTRKNEKKIKQYSKHHSWSVNTAINELIKTIPDLSKCNCGSKNDYHKLDCPIIGGYHPSM